MKKSGLTLVAAATLLLLIAAVWGLKTILDSPSADAPRGAVVILIDTLRPDHLSCYGYGRETSPELSALAREGVLFEKVVSAAPWTLPSVVSFFAGHRPNREVFEQRLKRSLVAEIRDAGFTTAAFTEGGYVSAFFGLDLGFDSFVEEEGPVRLFIDGQARQGSARGGIARTFRLAREWLATNGDENFFLFIHTYEPHVPYTRATFTKGLNPGKVGCPLTLERLPLIREGKLVLDDVDLAYIEALYDGGIAEADRHVGEFVDYLEELGLRDDTLLVVTSDHGEELGAHYRAHTADHGHALLDEQILVPLIIDNPCEKYAMKRIPHQVRLCDVMPTVAGILGVPTASGIDGASLLPLMHGEESKGRLADGGATKAGPSRVFLRWLDYKYIRVIDSGGREEPLTPRPPAVQLYNLRADGGEKINLSRKSPKIMRQMQKTLDSIVTARSSGETFVLPEDVDEALRERLESLGY